MKNLRNELIAALSEIIQLDAVSSLKQFVEGEVSLLFLLSQMEKPIPPTEIAKTLNISKGRVTALINSLKEKEYIDISISSEDRRKFDISLTDKGEIFLRQKRNEAEKYFDTMIERIGNEKSEQLISLIKDIVFVMKE